MRVELTDPNGRMYVTESKQGDLIGMWVAEYAEMIQADKASWSIRVWLSDDAEAGMFGNPYMRQFQWNAEELDVLIGWLRRVREKAFGKPVDKKPKS